MHIVMNDVALLQNARKMRIPLGKHSEYPCISIHGQREDSMRQSAVVDLLRHLGERRDELDEVKANIDAGEQLVFDGVDALFAKLEADGWLIRLPLPNGLKVRYCRGKRDMHRARRFSGYAKALRDKETVRGIGKMASDFRQARFLIAMVEALTRERKTLSIP